MVARKAFLVNPKLQYHVSQIEEHDCGARDQKNGDSFEYTILCHFTNEL